MSQPASPLPDPDSGHQDDAAGLLAHYGALKGVYDELVDSSGAMRPHWRPFLKALAGLGRRESERRFAAADQYLRDSGVFYRVYHDPAGAERAWPLSHVPLIIGSEEWHHIEAGLIERAEVIEAVLTDAYGAGKLCRDGLLPAAALAGSPEFLRPLVGIQPRGGAYLHVYAADLGRGPDGHWWVLGDRTQAPSGLGYALENRIALSRAMPETYQSLKVERLAGFFQAFRASLTRYNRPDDARICLLTPGPLNETYFEHAYLARYLGFLLVEGEDLTVRGEEIFVRTISGLKRADVIWRRLDSDFADPLELNPRSRLGVPGLVGALRNQGVVLANALGTGLAEAPALLGFLPAIAERLRGAKPLLPNIATWWCGQPAEQAYVLEHFDEIAIAPAFAPTMPGLLANGAVVVAELDEEDRESLRQAVKQHGRDYVGQEVVKLSTMPAWRDGGLEPRPFMLRVYVARTEQGWSVMPGGFTRVSDSPDPRAISMQVGGRSADVWISSEGPVKSTTLLPSPASIAIRRQPGALPSRAADNLFWLGRYLERAEATLRVLRALLPRAAEYSVAAGWTLKQLTRMLDDWGAIDEETPRTVPVLIAGRVLHDHRSFGAVPVLLASARRAASVIRDRFSPDAWRAVNNLIALLDRPLSQLATEAEALHSTNEALQMIAAFSGLAQENMNRLNGWRFLDVGRRIERAVATCRYIRQFAAPEAPFEALDTLLELCDSQITYRLRYVMGAVRAPVIDLVALDPNNPRAIAFQLDRIEHHLGRLPQVHEDGLPSPAQRIIGWLAADFRIAEARDVTIDDIDAMQDGLSTLSNEIALRYFTHRGRAEADNEIET